MWHLIAFAIVLACFHVSEYTLACIFMRKEVSWSSWLLSKPYCIAMGTATLEYCLEAWLAPSLKTWGYPVATLGLATIVLGEVIRKTGMITAGCNFTHMIRHRKHPDHVLVTWGIYKHVRHPGYLGWFMWAIGTQLLLVNPVCLCAFALVSWRFFNVRIQIEEDLLRGFFSEYPDYASRTPTWIPFIP